MERLAMPRRLIASLLLAALSLAGSAFAAGKDKKKDPSEIGDRNVGKGLNFYTLDQEIALGKQLSIEVEKQAKIVDDSIVSEYINRLGQNLARNSDVTFPITFKLIESDEINAFTLPGGFVFINSGLFKASGNEAELAAAIAHEIGHAAARHATRQASRNQLVGYGSIPLSVFGGLAGLAARQAANAAAPMAFMKFSREFETEADLLGIQYLWKSGYDPNAAVDFFEALQSTEHREPGRVARLFRTHPLTSDRIEKTQKNIDTLLPARGEYVLNTSEYEEIRVRLEGLTLSSAESSADRANSDNRPTLIKRQR
jgi:beta-barrel assembly-enhancing protease